MLNDGNLGTLRVFRRALLATLTGTPLSARSKAALQDPSETLAVPFNRLTALLAASPYLATSRHPTIADVGCYCELDQLAATGLVDFATHWPDIHAWMERMRRVPHHDDVRSSLYRLAPRIKKNLSETLTTAKL